MKVSRQPEVNIGMVGHVDHGKTTLTKALTGEWTDRHSEEIKRGISIKLGYADAEFYQCPSCPEPDCYSTLAKCARCGGETKFLRAVSFVDVPGHETLMAIMLCGAALMDGALLLISGADACPQPQTREHLQALEILKQQRLIVVQNKIDIADDEAAKKNYDQIQAFVKGTIAEKAPIIPVSAHHTANIDALIMAIQRIIPSPKLDPTKPPRMIIARSFDVNLPGARPKDLKGGVIGGSIIQGTLKEGDEIEIQPGTKVGKRWEGIRTKAVSLVTGGHRAESVRPGGLVGIGTGLDPALTKADGLVGKIAGIPGSLPPVVEAMSLEIHLLERVVGTEQELKVEAIRTNEPLMLNAGSATTVGVVRSTREQTADVTLKLPLCIDKGASLAVSRKVGSRWRLIGYAKAH